MCTVVFIPGRERIYLGSLRDESPKRPRALVPEIYTVGSTSYVAPKDPMASGTWVGASDTGNAIVLLNGGFENHQRKSYYRKSRGLIVTELLASELPVVEWSLINMQDIEPFTLIVWSDDNLFELVWDGNERYRTRLDATQPHIWSSSTLYNAEAKAIREEFFQNWIAMNPPVSKLSVLNFFRSFKNDENGFIMNRNEITKTLSYSLIELYPQEKAVLNYYDFMVYSYSIKTIFLQKRSADCPFPGNEEIIFSKN
ncbi:MAG: NRDE family protein [Rhizobacter sp.]|nr:NRDE family protein [Ferruginibacter sp.]